MNHIKRLNLKQLFYFSEVYKRGSVNAAANYLNMVQAGIGRQIQLLEQELGVRLFERGTRGRGMVTGGQGRGMVPTDAAHLVYDFYCQYRDQQDKLTVALEELHQMKRGEIRIAVFNTYVDSLVEDVLDDFYHAYPSLNIEVKEVSSTPQIITQVLQDDVHMGIIYGYGDNSDIGYRARASLPLCLLVNPHHPLANKKKVDFEEISSCKIILPPASHNLQHIIQKVERSEKIQLKQIWTNESMTVRKKAAIAGYGGMLTSEFAASSEIKAGQLVALKIDHPIFMSMEACLIVRRGRLLSPAANQLIRLIAAKFSIFAHNTFEPISKNTPLSGITTLSMR